MNSRPMFRTLPLVGLAVTVFVLAGPGCGESQSLDPWERCPVETEKKTAVDNEARRTRNRVLENADIHFVTGLAFDDSGRLYATGATRGYLNRDDSYDDARWRAFLTRLE